MAGDLFYFKKLVCSTVRLLLRAMLANDPSCIPTEACVREKANSDGSSRSDLAYHACFIHFSINLINEPAFFSFV